MRGGGAAATSLPQLLYNRTVEKILSRLARPPNYDDKGKVDPHAVWAQDVVNEVRAQFSERPGIMEGHQKPDYARCVAIVTEAALAEMRRPGALALCFPIGVGFVFRFLGSFQASHPRTHSRMAPAWFPWWLPGGSGWLPACSRSVSLAAPP